MMIKKGKEWCLNKLKQQTLEIPKRGMVGRQQGLENHLLGSMFTCLSDRINRGPKLSIMQYTRVTNLHTFPLKLKFKVFT